MLTLEGPLPAVLVHVLVQMTPRAKCCLAVLWTGELSLGIFVHLGNMAEIRGIGLAPEVQLTDAAVQ